MTVVEAMALGVPVIASDIPAHREIAGDAALYFDPFDAAGLAERCRTLLDDPALAGRLRAAGLTRARDFSWRRHFTHLLEAAAQVAS